ncbi:MAG TPA: vitamin B12 dependent-methionine synthase activation domain-containing protein, partial [Chitinophagaceae bacterium]|nr:vitamin B12 dependent-methionine synthase activation domain-containing protein [Chitinophagaceae bacterium]
RDDFGSKKTAKQYLPFEEAQKNQVAIDWNSYTPPVPQFTGTRILDNFDLNELVDYIDWGPFFIAWELHGRYPDILQDKLVGTEATKLFNDANALLDTIIREKWLTAQGVVGLWPANSNGADSVWVHNGDQTLQLEFLRQQVKKAPGQPNLSLADFVAPEEYGRKDYIGAFSVTIKGIEPHLKNFEASHDDYNKITLQALADRLAEAFAECMHAKIRTQFWAYVPDENLSNEDLIKESYQGIRPAPGYPACPDHTEKYKLFELLGGEAATGIHLTESLAMYPAASVCGWYFSHPRSQYFGIGKILQDQVDEYGIRKKMDKEEVTRWLRPVLD